MIGYIIKISLCGSRIYPYPHHRGYWKLRGGGGLKGQTFKAKYWPKLEFPEGWGVQTKKENETSVGEYGYFLEFKHIFQSLISVEGYFF